MRRTWIKKIICSHAVFLSLNQAGHLENNSYRGRVENNPKDKPRIDPWTTKIFLHEQFAMKVVVVVTIFPANYTKYDNVTYIISYLCTNTCVFISILWISFSNNLPGATREAIVLIVLVAQKGFHIKENIFMKLIQKIICLVSRSECQQLHCSPKYRHGLRCS